jgi:hypothetical protein
VRENESKRGKNDMDLPWSNKSDVAVFGGGKNFSLYFEF